MTSTNRFLRFICSAAALVALSSQSYAAGEFNVTGVEAFQGTEIGLGPNLEYPDEYYDEYYSKITISSTGTLNMLDTQQELSVMGNTDFEITYKSDVLAKQKDKAVLIVEKNGVFDGKGLVDLFDGHIYVDGTFNSDTLTLGSSSTTKAFVYITKTGVVNTTNISAEGGDQSTLRVEGKLYNSGTINVEKNVSGSSFALNAGAKVQTDILSLNGGTVDVGSATIDVRQINVNDAAGGKFNINEGGTLNINATNDLSVISDLNLKGTLSINSGAVTLKGIPAVNLLGGAKFNVGAGAKVYTTGGGTSDYTYYTFNIGGGTVATNKVSIYGKGDNRGIIDLTNADNNNDCRIGSYGAKGGVTFWAEDEKVIIADRVTLIANSEMALASKNLFVTSAKDDDGNFLYLNNTELCTGSGSHDKIYVQADNQFGILKIQNNSSLTFVLENNAVLTISEYFWSRNGGDQSSNLTINEFENNRVFVTNMDSLYDFKMCSIVVNATDALGGEQFTNGDISLSDITTYNGYEGRWLFVDALAIPEPAEWAAIFGAVALAFAMYRRRK